MWVKSGKTFTALIVLGAALAVAGAVLAFVHRLQNTRPDGSPREGQPAIATPGFHDQAQEAGLTFRMHFLPTEQGANYKVNLYDHGCGLAVGDFDGDGHDDIYFIDQLGANALYRNNGDGTFTDVTERAGVGLGDRICVA